MGMNGGTGKRTVIWFMGRWFDSNNFLNGKEYGTIEGSSPSSYTRDFWFSADGGTVYAVDFYGAPSKEDAL